MSRLRAIFAAAALCLAVSAPVAAQATGSPPTVISAYCHGHNFKPGRIILACGDAGLSVEHLTWSHWGKGEATGIGTGTGKTCEPSCAAGGTKSGRMEVRLSKPKLCPQDHRRHFTRARYRWTHGSPIPGQPDSAVVPFPCSLI